MTFGLYRFDEALRRLDLPWKRRITAALVTGGIGAMTYYFSWWFVPLRPLDGWRIGALALMLFYTSVQFLFAWYAYLRIEIASERTAPAGLSVDLVIPVYREGLDLLERALEAAVAIRYPHRTWLLDDAGREEFRELARRLGVEYVRRVDRSGDKAGNVNSALPLLAGEFISILDVDHIAEPTFLDAVLGHLDDPRVGFVQALVAHRNQDESFVAKASSGQADDVFGPSSMGWHGCGAAMVWGAHCTFRRAALDSIGGYQVGLAEDLLTSIALHESGWHSVYVPRIVARGLVPADLGGQFLQHLKWSSGVLRTLIGSAWRRLLRLRLEQSICYLTRMSYYLLGPAVFGHLLLLVWALLTGVDLNGYFLHTIPLACAAILIRKIVGALWEQDPRAGWQLIGTALAFSSWPVYLLALVTAIGRIKIPHLPTPKEPRGGNFTLLVVPQIVVCAALAVGVVVAMRRGPTMSDLTRATAALGAICIHCVAFWGVIEGWGRRRSPAYRRG